MSDAGATGGGLEGRPAVVFSRDVDLRTRQDPRLQSLEKEIAGASETQKRRLPG